MKKLIIIAVLFSGLCVYSSLGAQTKMSSSFHTLVLNDDGTVWACGDNVYGQLGNGTANKGSNPVPARVIGLTDVVSIDTGVEHSLALKRDGTVWAWGWNMYGQLGNGTTADRWTPAQVAGLTEVIAVSAGYAHSLALKSDGTVWAWGWGALGRLGDGTWDDHWAPIQVIGLSDAVDIAAGGEHSLALKSDGTVWAWGYNYYGELGDGTYEDRLLPVQVIGLSNVLSISSGSSASYSLALKRDGTVWAWGFGRNGQLGDGTTGNSPIPVKSRIEGVIDIVGSWDTSYALTSYGAVWWWGRRLVNYVPDIIIQSITPVMLDGIANVKAIGGGFATLALKNDGTIWAWGVNPNGVIGDGTTIDRPNPVQVFREFSMSASSPPASVLAADFDADGRADPTAVDNSGQWFFWYSHLSYSREGPIELGMTGPPAAGDVDGDGRGDMAIVDSSGQWYFWLSSRGYYPTGPHAFGVSGTPVLGDFDGDGKADPAIVDSSGTWFVWLSAAGYSQVSAPFAVPGATPLAADFDGDGRADPVMVSATGGWYFWLSSSFYIQRGPFNFGLTGPGFAQAEGSAAASKPAAGDFDGDAKADPAMMDSSGNWYFWLSGAFYTRDGPYYLVMP